MKKCSGFKKTLPKLSGVESELDGVGDTGVSTFGDVSGECTSEKRINVLFLFLYMSRLR